MCKNKCLISWLVIKYHQRLEPSRRVAIATNARLWTAMEEKYLHYYTFLNITFFTNLYIFLYVNNILRLNRQGDVW